MEDADLKAEIAININTKWGELIRAKNTGGLTEMYSVDCKYMPPNSPVIHGRDAMTKVYQGFFNAGAADGKLETDEIGPCGNEHVFTRGTYNVWKSDGSVLEKGKVVMILKREDGKLMIYIDIDNTF